MSLQHEHQEKLFPSTQIDQMSQFEEHLGSDDQAEGEKDGEADSHFSEIAAPHDEKVSTHTKRKEQKEGYTAQFDDFKKQFEEQIEPEIKLQLALDFMEASLAQGGTPHFRSFWEARRLCLPLFKENILAAIRSQLWHKYSELSKEARRLKEILDEQSTFAVEQIDIAIQALEKDILSFEEQVEKTSFPDFALFPQALKVHTSTYHQLQKQLNILNAHASRINALRKELLKTEMRIRHKNKFFQRLSSAGDQVFPKRKELIKEISQQFSDDVDQFIHKHFGEHPSQESLFLLREEIKALQGLAKILTLNTQSFTHTRTRLSECWDKIKVEEKERKKERAHLRVIHKQNFEEIEKQIQALQESLASHSETWAEVQHKLEGIVLQIRKVELGREELKLLRDALSRIRKLIYEKKKIDEDARQFQENERERQKKEKYHIFQEQAEQLLNHYETQDVDQLISERDALVLQIQNSFLSKNEKQEFDRILKPLRDIITDKKEKALLALSDDDRQSLLHLKNILQQRKDRRLEIKNQLEILRKAAGSSSLDFEKAMSFKNQINEEKESLEKANQAILEIERKIIELQAKIKN